MKTRPHQTILNLVINNVHYAFCSMNVDMTKYEFFYHFKYAKDCKKNILHPNRQEKIHRLDHISFHKDGSIHQNFKGKRLWKATLPNNTFVPTDKNSCIPLLAHSIYPKNGRYPLPQASGIKEDEYTKVITNNFLYPYNKAFSLVLFLAPDSIPIEGILNNYVIQINDSSELPLNHLGHSAGQILAWDNWTIYCIITDLALSLHDHSPLYCHAHAYTDMNEILTNLLLQRRLS